MVDMVAIRKSLYDQRAAGLVYSGAEVLALFFTFFFALILSSLGIEVPDDPSVYPDWYRYCGYILPQAVFCLTVVLFFVFVDAKPKEVYRGAKVRYFLVAVLLQFGLFSLSRANAEFIGVLERVFGYTMPASGLPSLEGWYIVPVLLVVAVLPAVFEESIFRGLMLGPMKKFSTPVAVLLSGALFALYHQSPAQTVYQFCCGCAFALVAIRAGSVLPTMLAHFLNNAFVIVLTACGISDFTGAGGIAFYCLSGLSLAASLVYLLFVDRTGNEKKSVSVKPFLLTASAGVAVCAILWVANLLDGMGVFG